MTLTWSAIKTAVRSELGKRDLKAPSIRLNALERVETLLVAVDPSFRSHPEILRQTPRKDMAARLAKAKGRATLSGAEASILNNIHQVLNGELGAGTQARQGPGPTSAGPAARTVVSPTAEPASKLLPIAQAVAAFLEKELGHPASFALEAPLPWLDALLAPATLGPLWEDVCRVYAALVDGRFALADRLRLRQPSARAPSQRVDIWFAAPYSFALEFDEKQHFNPYRLRTLQEVPRYRALPLDYDAYMRQCASGTMRPGTSGFSRLRTADPLFPPMYDGEAQDNRIRQRAFRDLLKDLIPLTRPDVNPTWRVGSYLIGGKVKGFDPTDCRAVVEHLHALRAVEHIKLKGPVPPA
jgi:hypothetical protein